MRRSGFLKRLVAGFAALTVAPQIVKSENQFPYKNMAIMISKGERYKQWELGAHKPQGGQYLAAHKIEYTKYTDRIILHVAGNLTVRSGNILTDVTTDRPYFIESVNALNGEIAIRPMVYKGKQTKRQRACGNLFIIYNGAFDVSKGLFFGFANGHYKING